MLQPWQVVLLLLVPSLFWLARGVWLFHRENQRRKRIWYSRQDTPAARAWFRKRREAHPMTERWENDE